MSSATDQTPDVLTSEDKRVVKTIMMGLWGLVIVFLVTGYAALFIFARINDQNAQTAARDKVLQTLVLAEEDLAAAVADYSDWTDLQKAYTEGDTDWIVENFYASIDVETFDLMGFLPMQGAPEIQFDMDSVQDVSLSSAVAEYFKDLHRDDHSSAFTRYVSLDNTIWHIGSHRLRSHTIEQTDAELEQLPVMIYGRRIGRAEWSSLLQTTGVSGVRIAVQPDLDATDNAADNIVPLLGMNGDVIASLSWDAPRPGTAILWTGALPTLGMTGLILLIAKIITGRVTQIARGLQNQRIRALEADRAKSVVLANVSHELRTPLNGILGASQLIDLDAMPQEDRELVKIITDSAEAQLDLIEDLLRIARADAGEDAAQIEAVDLGEILNTILAPLELSAISAGLVFERRIDPAIPNNVQTDKRLLRQILTNLIGNAIKFTERGAVSVSLAPGSDPKEVVIEVKDTGPGIPDSDLNRIFDRFAQVESNEKAKKIGTGLGLSITHSLVECLNGHIRAASTLGEGATFTVILPMAGSDPMQQNAAA